MELEVQTEVTESGIQKHIFQTKTSRRDGLILQIHHTVPTDGDIHRVRFLHMAFSDSSEMLAAVDHRGNIFIIDLLNNKFWVLPNLGPCTFIAFSPYKKTEILAGNTNCALTFMNIEMGKVTGSLEGHETPAVHVSFSSDQRYCLTSSAKEAIIWDLHSNTQAHRLTMRNDVEVKKVLFMPVSNNILACFQDDAMHIWKFETLECVKQIVPEAWKSHHIKSIAFTRNGRAMVVGGRTNLLVVFEMDTWTVSKLIELPDRISGVKHVEFVPQLFDGGSNKILGLLTVSCTIFFLDIESSVFSSTTVQPEHNFTKFISSPNGKYIAGIIQSGEVNIYTTSQLMNFMPHPKVSSSVTKMEQSIQRESKLTEQREAQQKNQLARQEQLSRVSQEIEETLSKERLQPMLQVFGEYPESYRVLIWRSILHLPQNRSAYVCLVNRDCHPAYVRLEEDYPLENRASLKSLKRLLSCLAHWSPLFAEVPYLPLLVFPFVKVFQNDPFICFEAVMTVIINWCQFWFEYFPHYPLNILAMVENVMAEQDPELLKLFYDKGVTSQLYAWPLLEVMFSEVLTRQEWLKFWDHVITNEPSFLLMAVVAYNVVCRVTLKSCKTIEDFEFFYHNQNPIDIKRFISKTYQLCLKTSDEVHPRQYLRDFHPLEKGSYPVFNEYPKFVVDYKAHELEEIRREEEEIIRAEQEAVKLKTDQEQRKREQEQVKLQAERLLQLEMVYRDSLRAEEERVAEHRRKVLHLRRELEKREVDLLESARDQALTERTHQRMTELHRLLDELARKRIREESYLEAAEEEFRRHYNQLMSQKCDLERQLGVSPEEQPTTSPELRLLQQQQEKLNEELGKLREECSSEHHKRQLSIMTRVATVEEMLQRVETELAREMAEQHHSIQGEQDTLRTLQLEADTKTLEVEVEKLLAQLTEVRLQESGLQVEEMKHSLAARQKLAQGHRDVVKNIRKQTVKMIHRDQLDPDWHTRKHVQLPSKSGREENTSRCPTAGITTKRINQSSYGSGNKDHTPSMCTDASVWSKDYYEQEQDAIRRAMDVRLEVANEVCQRSSRRLLKKNR